jgi:energy-coupling factor transport system permease protein
LWAIGLAVAASRTRNPVLLLLILAVAGFVVAARRSDAPWANSYAAFLRLGLLLILIRVILQALLSTRAQGSHVLVLLPEVPLPDWASGVKLGGEVTAEAVLIAVYDGLQLAVMLCCIGAANALASPRRLLKSLPGALYEIGVACVVALTFAPQLVTDAHRIRAARRLRGRTERGLRVIRTTGMPILEGALDRSIELAAAMDSRGYGRGGGAARPVRLATGALLVAGLLGVCVGVYGLLDGTSPGWLGLPMLLLGLLVAGFGLPLAGRRVRRSVYRPDPWRVTETLVAASGLVPAAVLVLTARVDPGNLYPSLDPLGWPGLPLGATLAVLVALLPAWLAPPPVSVVSPARAVAA